MNKSWQKAAGGTLVPSVQTSKIPSLFLESIFFGSQFGFSSLFFLSFSLSFTNASKMSNDHGVVYMAPPPDGRPRFDGSPTRQFAMGLVSIVTTFIAFAVVSLRILTRKYIVKMPFRVDDCEFC